MAGIGLLRTSLGTFLGKTAGANCTSNYIGFEKSNFGGGSFPSGEATAVIRVRDALTRLNNRMFWMVMDHFLFERGISVSTKPGLRQRPARSAVEASMGRQRVGRVKVELCGEQPATMSLVIRFMSSLFGPWPAVPPIRGVQARDRR